ncbi:hypothetical protein D3C84_907820 [compost metagenome]
MVVVIDDTVREVAAFGEHATFEVRIGRCVESVLSCFSTDLPTGIGVQFMPFVLGGYRCANILEGLHFLPRGELSWGGQIVRGFRETELFHQRFFFVLGQSRRVAGFASTLSGTLRRRR